MQIFMYFRCESDSKIGFKKKLGWAEDTKKHILIKYFVRIGNPKYLWTKQENIFFSNSIIYEG